ncbi:MAG: glycine zipper domain-containing protein [Novosphingobium sp.]
MRSIILPALVAGTMALGGCASNYAGEGALAGGALGAGVGAVTDADTGTAAAVGAAAGAAVGSQVKKHRDGCWRYDRDGRRFWDDNC